MKYNEQLPDWIPAELEENFISFIDGFIQQMFPNDLSMTIDDFFNKNKISKYEKTICDVVGNISFDIPTKYYY